LITDGTGAAGLVSAGVTRLVALRHGQTAWNAEQRVQGHRDIALDATGREQAERLAAALAGEGIEAIYASDLQRAADTAAATARRLGLPVHANAGLRERCFGVLEGHTHAEIEAHWPEDALRWRRRDLGWAADGGESLPDFSARCIQALTQLASRHPGQTIAVFSHGGVLDMLYRAATHQPLDAPRSWALGNATINRVLFNGEGFVLIGWNDSGHLDG
jgi:2,3-bisphosphoglycerate-dependent phosphoglycerate mutase